MFIFSVFRMIQHQILKPNKTKTLPRSSLTSKSSLRSLLFSSSFSSSLDQSHPYPFHVKEETIDSQQTFQTPLALPIDRFTPSTNILTSSSASLIGNRRASTRQQKRRTLREPNSAKDSLGSAKKKTRIDNGNLLHADIGADNLMNIDQLSNRSNSTDQQINENLTSKATDE